MHGFSRSLALAATATMGTVAAAAPPATPQPVLRSVEMVWDQGPHNAFTDLERFGERWVCAFREAPKHAGGVRDSRIRVLASDDAKAWTPVASLADPRGDIRDAKLAVIPDGRLMLLTAIQLFDQSTQHHQSLVWLTSDLETWEGPFDVGQPDLWLWGIAWHKGAGYSIAYHTGGGPRFTRLYRTPDGLAFEPLVERIDVDAPYPNESAIVFGEDDTAYALLRCDPDHAYLGTAPPPYTQWTWRQLDARIGGPALTWSPDGRLLGAGRLYDGGARTALFWIDPATAKVTECLTLPSGGDTSYPGLVWQDRVLHMSYYDSREGKSNIYLARVEFPQAE